MKEYEGTHDKPTGRFAIVASRFNQDVVDRLVQGAQEGFKSNGVIEDSIDLIWVPGSFEIPLVAQRLASSGKYAAVVCLGAVIRGDTDHYDFIASEAADYRRAGDLRYPHLRDRRAGLGSGRRQRRQ